MLSFVLCNWRWISSTPVCAFLTSGWFAPQFVQLLLHELRETGRGAEADRVGMLQVRLRNPVGHVGSEPLVGRLVADQEEVSVWRPCHFQLFENHRSVFHFGFLDLPRVPVF